MIRGGLGLLAFLVAGCATVPLDHSLQVETDRARFVVHYAMIDSSDAATVASVLPGVMVRLTRWGSFAKPVAIYVQPSHAALESAVFHPGYTWLRAWARYDTIDLQAPVTWGTAQTGQVAELLTHELTHCLMYQASTAPATWMFKRIPLWFREGMASVTANQGYRRMTRAEISAWLDHHPSSDPVAGADDLYESEPAVVYSAAHRAFEQLDATYGDAAILRLLGRMSAGAGFEDAFRLTIGISEERFERSFIEGLRPARTARSP